MIFDLIVIGGGAAGFFGAINTAANNPEANILILEKSNKLLSKVKVSGGGRCNVTHNCFQNSQLAQNYPRGSRELKQAFNVFNAKKTVNWFKERGITIVAEEDGRMFPASNSSQTIIDCFLQEVEKYKIKINEKVDVVNIKKENGFFILTSDKGIYSAKHILVATGGHPQKKSYDFLKELIPPIINPIPSLFTFNLPGNSICNLMGVAVENTQVTLTGTKLKSSGPLLITHWGMSGPVIIKLSALGAEELHKKNYHFNFSVNWTGDLNFDTVRDELMLQQKQSKKIILNQPLFQVPKRLWEFLLEKTDIPQQQTWAGLSKRQLNKLTELLTNDVYEAKGKTTFKEEFVTCGGVSLKEIDFTTMQSKQTPGLYFAGEVLNIDGITGGFNFQAAWTTSYIAAMNIAKKIR